MKALILGSLALAFSDAATAYARQEILHCVREFKLAKPLLGSGSLAVDWSHRPMGRTLRLGESGLWITWAFPTATFDISIPPDELKLPTVELPLDTQFPVTAVVQFDGTEVWRHEFQRPTSAVMVVPRPSVPPRSKLFFQPGVDITIRPRELPSLLGVRQANLLVTSSDHKVRLVQSRQLPDWMMIQAEATRVAAELEADRLGGKCRPPAPPVV